MPAKKQPPIVGNPEVGPTDGIRLLKQQIMRGEEMLARPINSDSMGSWDLLTKNFLVKTFGENSPNVSSITDVGRFGMIPINAGEAYWENRRAENLRSKLSRLQGLVELLQTEIELVGGDVSVEVSLPMGRRVFLVHGHNDGLLHEVARFLEKLALEPIILREQPNGGRTIIEKFVDYSDVAYAVVLLTPDDRGGEKTVQFENQNCRARQNVILELGYFLGKLSRNRVTALYQGEVEIPSDYAGVAFVKIDDQGAWRLELAREVKASGLTIDMNLAI